MPGPEPDLQNLLAELRRANVDPAVLYTGNEISRLRELLRPRLSGRDPLRRVMDSEDLAQSALLDLVDAIDRFRGTTWAELVAFAGAITRQRLLHEGRRQGAQKRNGRRNGDHAPELLPADSSGSPSRVAVREEQKQRILECVHRLPAEYRAAVEGVLAGLAYEQIAERAGLSVEAARKRVSRAMQMLSTRWLP